MNFEKYLTESKRTESRSFTIENMPLDLLHAVIGINTEAVELLDSKTTENDLEEIGDLFWYIAIIYRKFDYGYSFMLFNKDVKIDHSPLDIISAKMMIVKIASDMLNDAKKVIFYGSKINENLKDEFRPKVITLISYLFFVMNCYGVKIETILQENIDKLYKRYPEKFSEEHAEIRLDKAGE